MGVDEVFEEAYRRSIDLGQMIRKLPGRYPDLGTQWDSLHITISMRDVSQAETIWRMAFALARRCDEYASQEDTGLLVPVHHQAIQVSAATMRYLVDHAPFAAERLQRIQNREFAQVVRSTKDYIDKLAKEPTP